MRSTKLGLWSACLCAALAAALGIGGPVPKLLADSSSVDATPSGAITSGSPLSVSLVPEKDLQIAIRAVSDGDKTTTLRLTFVGATPPSSKVSVRVYLNPPRDKPLPDTDSPHYVASFSFYGAAGAKASEDMMLSLNAAVARLQRSGLLAVDKPLTITAIAVPLKPGGDVSDVKIPFKRLRLSAVRGP